MFHSDTKYLRCRMLVLKQRTRVHVCYKIHGRFRPLIRLRWCHIGRFQYKTPVGSQTFPLLVTRETTFVKKQQNNQLFIEGLLRCVNRYQHQKGGTSHTRMGGALVFTGNITRFNTFPSVQVKRGTASVMSLSFHHGIQFDSTWNEDSNSVAHSLVLYLCSALRGLTEYLQINV